jgi:hypothetical protein
VVSSRILNRDFQPASKPEFYLNQEKLSSTIRFCELSPTTTYASACVTRSLFYAYHDSSLRDPSIDGLALPRRWRLSSLKTTKGTALTSARMTAAVRMTRIPRSSGVALTATARIASTTDNVTP